MHVQSTLNPSPPTVDGTWDDRRLQEEYLIKILDNLHRFDSFAKLADWINLSIVLLIFGWDGARERDIFEFRI